MKIVSKILSVFAFVTAITAAFAFNSAPLADQITNAGYSDASGICTNYTTVQSNCDLEETSGTVCTVIVAGQSQTAKKVDTSCGTTLFRDDD